MMLINNTKNLKPRATQDYVYATHKTIEMGSQLNYCTHGSPCTACWLHFPEHLSERLGCASRGTSASAF